jgi:RNA polymerase sigma-70 factor (ECF subfamily)
MSMVETTRGGADESAIVTAARAGDESAFSALVERYRRELQVHCYRMLGSFDDAEDLVQETFLRAWRKRESFAGRASFRAWLYRIATNACLDFLASDQRRVIPSEAPVANAGVALPPPHIPWLQPYPDRLLEQMAPREAEPDAVVVSKETIELAFLVAIQLLPPKQRAVLILRDVLDWSAKETAELLDTSVASVNSALQRARTTLQAHLPPSRLEWAPNSDPTEEERALLQRYVDASEQGDPGAIAALLHEDVRFSMPPQPDTWVGRDTVVNGWVEGGFGSASFGDFRCVVTRANMMPAVACYHRKPGASEYRAFALDVLRIEDGQIAEITAFDIVPLLDGLGLPPTL